jgi:predicted  nucleic acid-binding Zn-ribbon protein
MEQKQREQKEAISIQENENKKLLEELETCRLDAIKEVGKMREEFNVCLTELKEKSSSQELSLKQELKLLREQSKLLALELEERKLQIAADGKTSDEEVTNLTLKLHEGQEQYDLVNNELVEIKASYAALETNLQEALSESDTLRDLVNVLETKIDATKEDTSKEVKQMKNNADQWRKKVAACEDKLKESLTRHSKLATENNQLSEKLTRAEAVIAKLSANLSESMEQANGFEEIAKKLEKSKKIEKVTRMEIAQLRSEIARKNSNEKHLEDHVASLEEQVNKLVSDYESKLEKQSAKIRTRKS